MKSKNIFEQAPLDQLPRITRARGFRLYGANGKRYVDLWQAGGAAILGHNPPGVLRELKNTAERGLFAPLPTHVEGRFFKALATLLPGYSFYIYADEHSLHCVLSGAGFSGAARPIRSIFDPALGDGHNEGCEKTVSLWRPFLPVEDTPSCPLLAPVLPWPLAPKTLAVRNGAFPVGCASAESACPPASDAISPVTLAAATRAVYDLLAEIGAETPSTYAGARMAPLTSRFPVLAKALASSAWRRKGVYLHYGERLDDAGYLALFQRFLEAGFLLPTDQNQPAILPAVLSAGEEAKLAALVRE
ncbi:MAG: hypothetical protein LBD58_12840 [Treponema sp.]|jgi:hypothetical protein|nr:hypothetical protein [Treponema sp.]